MECKARAFHVFARRMFHWTVLLSPEEFIGQSFRTLQAKYETLSLDEIRRIGALVIQRSYMVGPSSHTSALPVHIGDSFYAADRPQRNTPAKMIVHMAKVNELTDENTFTLSESYQGANSDGSIVLPSTLSSQLGKKAFQKDFDGLFDFHYGLGLTYYGLKLSAKVTAEEHGMRASTPSASDSSFKDWIEMNTPPYNNLGKLSKYYSRRVEKTLTGRPCITTIPIKLPFEISESTGRIWSMLSSGYMLDDSGFADHNLMGATEVCNTAAASSDPLISLLKLEGKANECKWQWTQKNISTTC
ncbi:hypothetical protein SARC_02496 [Sphaeroforma arctica JP610]|uniref:Uncharacterized protein n=1 Tax=Sphaeroforma arctica JP610 TaxID=667725 RepID=A0A0L0GAM9_9EUKA|nr:hypothetical protein SARC_02496 [Sphaeroforma arctica JP610]KNC85313.1 hypothetical protein SARC_02496 [Sphaeroforma arctica JP610]|eukprot:XP_014159215.1 hypothetical protein SARC_02496 [Sphaeroforma arctica JP610]